MSEAAVSGEEPSEELEERESLRQRFAHLQFRTMERLAMRWPERPARRVFSAYTALLFHAMPSLRTTVSRNLARVLGQDPSSEIVRATTREAFSLYAKYWYESFRVRVYDQAEMNKRFSIQGLDVIDQALQAGRGAIFALPHLGNWDAAAKFLTVNGYRLTAVAEELKPRRMYELFLRHRQELGMKIVPLTADRASGLELARLLSENWLVALVADRDLGGRGVDVEMFGATRKLPAGPALLSLRTGAPLLPSAVYTTDDGWDCIVGAPLRIEGTGDTRADVKTLTHMLAAEFERYIAAKPEDWHMFQAAWDS